MLITFFPFQSAIACSCGSTNITSRYMVEDFIGIVEINSINEAEHNQGKRLYKANIDSIQTFKGTVPDSIFVSGTVEMSYDGQCEVSVKPGQKWLLYLQKEENGHYVLSWCDNPLPIVDSSGKETAFGKRAQKHIKKLTYLKDNFPDFHSEHLITYSLELQSEFLRNYKTQDVNHESAYYVLTFNENVEVEFIDIIQGFGEETDQKIIQFFETDSLWHAGYFTNPKYSIPTETEYIINMNYYKDTGRIGFADLY